MIDFLTDKERIDQLRDISSDIEIWEPNEMCDRLWELVKNKLITL